MVLHLTITAHGNISDGTTKIPDKMTLKCYAETGK